MRKKLGTRFPAVRPFYSPLPYQTVAFVVSLCFERCIWSFFDDIWPLCFCVLLIFLFFFRFAVLTHACSIMDLNKVCITVLENICVSICIYDLVFVWKQVHEVAEELLWILHVAIILEERIFLDLSSNNWWICILDGFPNKNFFKKIKIRQVSSCSSIAAANKCCSYDHNPFGCLTQQHTSIQWTLSSP